MENFVFITTALACALFVFITQVFEKVSVIKKRLEQGRVRDRQLLLR